MYNLGNININPTLNAGNVSTPFMKGEQGYSISRVARTEGTGEPGTTDIYTVYINTDPETAVGTFSVYNGAGGDMFKSVYDINNDGIVDKATADANGNDITTTYETISNVSALANRVTTIEGAGYITKSVSDLANYYLKTETYTKAEVNTLCDLIPKFAIEVVDSLPTQDISTTTIYLVRDDSQTGDIYQEYIYVNNTWELLGAQRIDLSNFYTKSETYSQQEVNTLLANKLSQINNPTYTTTEGTNLSINNTRVGKMKFEYYGDTEQETTTGKNLFNPSNVYLGKAWNNADNTARAIAYVPLTIGNTYTISMQNVSAVDMVLYNETDTSTLPYSIAPNQITTTTTITATKSYLYFQFNKTSVTINDILAVGIQVETGSTASSYEPYTGGIASPNPDYPSKVKTVTGENSIRINKIQLFDKSQSIVSGYTFGGTGDLTSASAFFYQSYYIPVTPNTTYKFSGSRIIGSDSLRVCEYTNDQTFIKRNYETYTVTTTADTHYVRVSNYSALLDTLVMVKGNTLPSTYEPYQGQSYEINLASRNLINPNSPYLGASLGITSIYNSANQSISFSGTTTGTWAYLTNKINIKIPKGNYTFSINKSMSTNTVIIRMYYNDTQYQDVAININTTSRSMNITNDTIAYQIYIGGLTVGTTLNESLNFQLEKRKRCYTIQAIFHTYRIM